jgi:DNA repair protein RadD
VIYVKELRWYQSEAIEALYRYFREKRGNPILALPTGTGKSIVIAEFVRQVVQNYKGQRVMMVTHVKELVDQNFKELIELWPLAPAGVYSAGLGRKEHLQQITFAGIGSVVGKGRLFGKVNILLVDECHTIGPKDTTNYQTFINELKQVNPNLKVIGLTATPYRMGQGMLTEPAMVKGKEVAPLFSDIAYDITGLAPFNRLVAEGYICKLIPKPTNVELDVSSVSMSGPDYNQHDLQAAVDVDEITKRALDETMVLGADRKHWLVFATGIQHAEHVRDALIARGIPSVVVHSKISNEERDAAVEGFKSGRYRALINNGVFTAGFNFPALDLIVILRPTQSVVLWVQMLGRGTRPVWPDKYKRNWHLWPEGAVASGRYDINTVTGRLLCIQEGPKQNCRVLDFAGNTKRLGCINDPVIPKRKGQKKGPQDAPFKICEHCNTYNHASARECIECGKEFEFITKLVAKASTDDLLAGEEPVVEVFPVKSINYSLHQKMGAPDSVKVSYFCGIQSFNEWICLEHPGTIGRKARAWWSKRCDDSTGDEIPANCVEALKIIEQLRTPTHLRVWLNKKYPQIMDADFSGTGWGTDKVVRELPRVKAILPTDRKSEALISLPQDCIDEDVPF